MYIANILDIPMADNIHITGANTNIRRTITPYTTYKGRG